MTDLTALTGPASPLEDERLRFFLDNRDLIRTWAALADEVSEAVDSELRRLDAEIEAQAGEEGIDLVVAGRVAGDTWEAPMLHRPEWLTPGRDGPDVAVGIGWDSRRIQPVRGWPGHGLPYVGVVASRASERGGRIEAAMRGLPETSLLLSRAYRRGSRWIVYRYIEAAPDWYADLPAWRAWVVDQLLETWRDCYLAIDQAVSGPA